MALVDQRKITGEKKCCFYFSYSWSEHHLHVLWHQGPLDSPRQDPDGGPLPFEGPGSEETVVLVQNKAQRDVRWRRRLGCGGSFACGNGRRLGLASLWLGSLAGLSVWSPLGNRIKIRASVKKPFSITTEDVLRFRPVLLALKVPVVPACGEEGN